MPSLRQRVDPIQYRDESASEEEDAQPIQAKVARAKNESAGSLLKFAKSGINNAKEMLALNTGLKENTPPEGAAGNSKRKARGTKGKSSNRGGAGRGYGLRERSSNAAKYRRDDDEDDAMSEDEASSSEHGTSEAGSDDGAASSSNGEQSDGMDESDDFEEEETKPTLRRTSRRAGRCVDSSDDDNSAEAKPSRQPTRRQPVRGQKAGGSKAKEQPADTRATRSTRRIRASGSLEPQSEEPSSAEEGVSSDSDLMEVEDNSKPEVKASSKLKEKRSKCSSGTEDKGQAKKRKESVDKDTVQNKLEKGAAVDKILYIRHPDKGAAEYHVKMFGQSFRKTRWLSHACLEKSYPQLLRCFIKKVTPDGRSLLEKSPSAVSGVEPEWLRAERILWDKKALGKVSYYVKWCGLDYAESTWESEDELKDEIELVQQYKKINAHPPASAFNPYPAPDLKAVPEFLNDRNLRDYQVISLNWMVQNWTHKVNCILGDEMGLGKTAQSIAVLQFMHKQCNNWGPFLVVAPLTTLGHWKREIETWTGMNVVVYAGGQGERDMIQDYEFFFNNIPEKKPFLHGKPKFHVLLTSYEMALKDKTILNKFKWKAAVLDEAHRMKSVTSSSRQAIESLDIEWKLLLTGTPIQNNLKELFGIMNMLNPEKYPDMEGFLSKYDGQSTQPPTLEQVKALQEELRPVLLRRMKEDVENLPEKEEVIVKVCLTTEQLQYYKALYSQQIGALLAGASNKNLPQMRNLAMELRKLCCHPFLCNGLEEDIKLKHASDGVSEVDLMIQASGKMVFLDKLLPKLQAEGRKVLIFSQFKIMLDVLEDYLHLKQYPVERIDGSVKSKERQDAIDRFMQEQQSFGVFLLSTRAGGQGITLTAADTVVIYDSDWNPQNDLQAMARCHRIGQSKEVTVYRLVAKDTYEEHLFKSASKKYGLDEAILGFVESKDPEQDSKKIAELLMYGAHQLNQANEEGAEFASENIDKILESRTEKRQIGNRAGNTFSVASFAVEEQQPGRAYWESVLPDAVAVFDQQEATRNQHEALGPRQRRKVNYTEAEQANDNDGEFDAEAEGEEGRHQKRRRMTMTNNSTTDGSSEKMPFRRARESKPPAPKPAKLWRPSEVLQVEYRLVSLGAQRTDKVFKAEAGLLKRHSREECNQVERVLLNTIRITSCLATTTDYAGVLAVVLEAAEKLTTCIDPSLDEAALLALLRDAAARDAARGNNGGSDLGNTVEGNVENKSKDGERESGKQEGGIAASVRQGSPPARGSQGPTPICNKGSPREGPTPSCTRGLTPAKPCLSSASKRGRENSASKPKPPVISSLTVKVAIGKAKGSAISQIEGLKQLLEKMPMPASAVKILRGEEFIKRIGKMADTYRHIMLCNARMSWYLGTLEGEMTGKGSIGGVSRGIPYVPVKAGLPSWWDSTWDEELLRGLSRCGWLPKKEVHCLEDILTNPDSKFSTKVLPPLARANPATEHNTSVIDPSADAPPAAHDADVEVNASDKEEGSSGEGPAEKESRAEGNKGNELLRLSESGWMQLKVEGVKRLKLMLEVLLDPAYYQQNKKSSKHKRPSKILNSERLSSVLTAHHRLPVVKPPHGKESTHVELNGGMSVDEDEHDFDSMPPHRISSIIPTTGKKSSHQDSGSCKSDLEPGCTLSKPYSKNSSHPATDVPSRRPGFGISSSAEAISPCDSDDDLIPAKRSATMHVPKPPSRSSPRPSALNPKAATNPSTFPEDVSRDLVSSKPHEQSTLQFKPFYTPSENPHAQGGMAMASGLGGAGGSRSAPSLKKKALSHQQSMLRFVKMAPQQGKPAIKPESDVPVLVLE